LLTEYHSSPNSITEITLGAYSVERRGKVRDLFAIGDRLLVVATDRLSAFDVVLPTPIPGKGIVLTEISDFWFDVLRGIVPDHRADMTLDDLKLSDTEERMLRGRSSLVRRAERIDIECVVRSHLAGSGWKEYATHGTLAGEPLPTNLLRAARLDEPRFTPAVKNDTGHDQNISRSQLTDRIGDNLAGALERISLELFARAGTIAEQAGFIIADTKFEFGMIDGAITLIDEALTPDSSRYWDSAEWAPGIEPASFDKQVVRDWLEGSGWDKRPPAPVLPDHVIRTAAQRYLRVRDRLFAATISGSGKEAM